MFPSTSEAIDAANTLKEFGKYLNSLRNTTKETKEMKQILYKFDANGFITKCNQYREKFECPCPFGLYSLDELIEYKQQALKAGNMKCAEMLEAKIKQMTD